MGFHQRDKEPQVAIGYKDGPKVAVVLPPTGPRPLHEVVDAGWISIAALVFARFCCSYAF
jgi:hypothetical protein